MHHCTQACLSHTSMRARVFTLCHLAIPVIRVPTMPLPARFTVAPTPSARQIGGVFAAEPHAAAALQALIPALVGLALLWAALSWLLLAAAAQFAHSESELLTITPATAAAAAAAGEPGNLPPVHGLAGLLARHWLGGCRSGPDARTSSGKPRRVGDVTEPLLAGADCGTAAMPIVSGAGVVPQVGTTLVAGSSQGLPFLPRCPSETCVC